MRTKTLTKLVAVVMLCGLAVPVSAASLTEAQISAILNLLTSFGADQATIANVTASLRGTAAPAQASSYDQPLPPAPAVNCVTLTHNLYVGSLDSQTGGEVSKLQKFLGIGPTGRFGSQTQSLVKSWQSGHGIQTTSASAGNVGPATRAAMACK